MKNSPVRTSRDAQSLESHRCQFLFSDGRRCRLPREQKQGSCFCRHHAGREEALLAGVPGEALIQGSFAGKQDQQAAHDELVSLSGEFKTANDVNHVLGKLFSLLAQNRISRRDAVAFAYIGQLLLQSLPSVRREIKDCLGASAWDSTLATVFSEGEPAASAD